MTKPTPRSLNWWAIIGLPLLISGIPTGFMVYDRIKAEGARDQQIDDLTRHERENQNRLNFYHGSVHLDPASTQPVSMK